MPLFGALGLDACYSIQLPVNEARPLSIVGDWETILSCQQGKEVAGWEMIPADTSILTNCRAVQAGRQ